MEVALADLVEEGELRRHTRRTRRKYEARRNTLIASLSKELAGAVRFDVPPGGMALWVEVLGGVSPRRWVRRAIEEGVVFLPGQKCTFDGSSVPFVRMGYAGLSQGEIREAVRRAARAYWALRC
jgi:GntR family transcriptional regulator/MocR family aminotransferase